MLLILWLVFGFDNVKHFKLENIKPITNFSVIIPFRNEAKNLPKLLNTISKLSYPKEYYQFIFVNDDSEDNSVKIIQQVLDTVSQKNEITETNLKLINNKRVSNSPKKDAITTAIEHTKYDWIITTDADCVLPENWLQILNCFIQERNPKMIVAPVNYQIENNYLHRFQLLDFMSMQGTTMGGFGIGFPFMCNGANLAYKKEEFIKLNGFDGNNHIASGDDVFLFEKFLADDKNAVQFLKSKDTIVTTFPVNSWSDLINQRVRWAAKTGNFKSIRIKLIGLLVLLVNLSILVTIFGAIFQFNSFKTTLLLLVIKFIVDLFLFLPTISFFKQEKPFLQSYLLSSLVYPFFSVWVIYKSFFTNYNWKGRSFKK
mgnify:CR=1 FL=1